ncbi:phosphoadenylyl-sulfate reductase [Sneathiella litorea]|uniref:Adenosine 5'-phosphosulfate reductase n=1 Tax=Sneathiella litorea TaxID=2606216 RepID=A0A6L8W3F7_9PROT|nr:phosphoadenylyl-sulfate reductase [Sneathiella litorea]MZR29034.1 phosphoadenylyl-sulfate reductase [Sneathiella litorea]
MTISTNQYCAESEAARLRGLYGHLSGLELLDAVVHQELRGQIMLSSSFGAESAVLLDMVAQVDPTIPVIFLDTRRLFGETLRYQKTLTDHVGLEDVRIVRPDDGVLLRLDPEDMLFNEDPDKCCHIRKVQPLDNILNEMGNLGFKAWITGRKQFQAETRTSLSVIEADSNFVKINPLADWSGEDIKQAFFAKNLPPHPLVADGFKSIGCMPCTSRVAEGADPRSGRWAGKGKIECGIHQAR